MAIQFNSNPFSGVQHDTDEEGFPQWDVDQIERDWEPDEWAIWDDIDRNPGSGYNMPRPE